MSSNKLKKTIKKLIGKNKFNRGKLTSNVSSTSYTDDSTFNESSNPKECLQQSSIEALPPASSNCSVSASFNEISIVKSSPPNKQSQSDVSIETVVNFKSLGVCDVLCEACERLGWKEPTKIQIETLPVAYDGRDIVGLAETGSGKTGAFALPIIQDLLERPQRLFALVMTPARELAFQISEQFEALGASIGLKCAVIVGGMDMMTQSIMLAKKPHVVIVCRKLSHSNARATRGPLGEHEGLRVKYLVLDEADRILAMDFEEELEKVLRVIPVSAAGRRTYLYSATMTQKLAKLQRAALHDPVLVQAHSKYHTVDALLQYYMFVPAKHKDMYLVWLLNDLAGASCIVFCATCLNALRVALMLRHLGFTAVPLHGQMSQEKRLGALNKFKSGERSLLVATDVASRGLDIPHVDAVVNLDVPLTVKSYVHRVGRTARAGRSGRAITLVTQYDVELYQRIEFTLARKLPLYASDEPSVLALQERVLEAQRTARTELSELQAQKKKGRAEGAMGRGRGKKRQREEDEDGARDSENNQEAHFKRRLAKHD